MTRIFLLFIVILTISDTQGQKKMTFEQCQPLKIKTDSSNYQYQTSIEKLEQVKLISHFRSMEYFTETELGKRDFMLHGTKKLSLDSLNGYQDANYTMNYQILEARQCSQNLIIISGYDGFIQGEDQRMSFLLFEYNTEQKWQITKAYIQKRSKPSHVPWMVYPSKKIMKNKYLKTIH